MSYKEQYQEEFEKELAQFLFLCNKKDGTMLISKVKEQEIDEHVRLACIATVLGYKKLLLKIIAHCEKYFDEFMKSLDTVSENFFKIAEWTTEFIENIEHPKAQNLLRDFWSERKADLNSDNFNIRQLLK